MKNRGIRFLTAVLLLACTVPLAEAAPKRNCGNRCESDHNMCMTRAKNGSARKMCKSNYKACKRTCS